MPGVREDGRRESATVYEFELDAGRYPAFVSATEEGEAEGDEEKLVGEKQEGRRDAVTVLAKWEDFKPTYRGKPQEGAKKLDPTSIYECVFLFLFDLPFPHPSSQSRGADDETMSRLSFMCRSSFGQQAGEFELEIVSLAEAGREGALQRASGWVERLVALMRGWREWVMSLVGMGGVRL
jgi:hypothetical protein